MKLIIDTDPGTDDCAALTILLKLAEVVAITTVYGNTSPGQTAKNACRITEFLGIENIPIYMGAHYSLTSNICLENKNGNCLSVFHGSDGLLDVPHIIPNDVKKQPEKDQTATNAIINLAKKFPGELTFVALGPLTNLAIATRLCPELPCLLDSLYMMGSSSKQGNVTPWAEFNFHCDALSANLVLNHFCKYSKVHMVPWETCLENLITFDQFHSLFSEKHNSASILLHATGMTSHIKDLERSGGGYVFADQFIAMLLLYPESAVDMQIYESAKVNYDENDPKYGITEYLKEDNSLQNKNGLIVYTKFNMDYMIASYKKVIQQ